MTTAISELFSHQRGEDFIIDHHHQHHKRSTSRAAPVGKRTSNPPFSRKVSNTFIAGIPYNVPSAHARQLKARVETAQTIEHHANKLVLDQALQPVGRVLSWEDHPLFIKEITSVIYCQGVTIMTGL